MGILLLPGYVNGTYEYIATWTNKHSVQQWTPCNVVPTIKTNGESNSVSSWLPIWTHPPWIALTNMCAIYGMMGVCNRFKIWRLLSHFFEWWVLHNIKGNVRFIKKSCPLLVQILFLGWIQSFMQWKLSKGSNVVICGSIKTLCVICKWCEISNPFHLKCWNKFSFHWRI